MIKLWSVPMLATDIQTSEENSARALWHSICVDVSGDSNPYFAETSTFNGGKLVGTTNAFRHNDIYNAALAEAKDLHKKTGNIVTLLSAGSSTGLEAYSLSYKAVKRGYDAWLRIKTLDISPIFTEIAGVGIYPQTPRLKYNLEHHDAKDLVEPYGYNYLRVRKPFRKIVSTLPPMSFLSLPGSDICADITVSVRALMYLRDPYATQQTFMNAMRALGSTTRHVLITDETMPVPGFHQTLAEGNSGTYSVSTRWARFAIATPRQTGKTDPVDPKRYQDMTAWERRSQTTHKDSSSSKSAFDYADTCGSKNTAPRTRADVRPGGGHRSLPGVPAMVPRG